MGYQEQCHFSVGGITKGPIWHQWQHIIFCKIEGLSVDSKSHVDFDDNKQSYYCYVWNYEMTWFYDYNISYITVWLVQYINIKIK